MALTARAVLAALVACLAAGTARALPSGKVVVLTEQNFDAEVQRRLKQRMPACPPAPRVPFSAPLR
jgi:hypothetical protein